MTVTWAEDTVVADFGAAAWEHMLEESLNELDSRQGDMSSDLGAIVTVTEGDLSISDGFQTAVGDRDAENITGQISENLIAGSGMLAVNHPFFLPDFGVDL